MTAEEYVRHYVSGQGNFESVPLDVALRAIEYAKQEAKQQMMKDAIEREVKVDAGGYPFIGITELYDYDNDVPLAKVEDKVRVLIIKE